MSATRRLLGALVVVAVLAACSDDDDPCAKTAIFTLKNATSIDLRVEVPVGVPDSTFAIAVDDSVELGAFVGELSGGYPDFRVSMACLAAYDATADTLVYRLGTTASTAVWTLQESDDCSGVFSLTLDDGDLGSIAATDSACAALTGSARAWSARR